MVTASYPSGLITYTTKKDRIDVVDDDHVNQLQVEQIALQQYIGTSPHGDWNSLSDRLNAQFDGSGFLISSTGVPAVTYPRQLYYRSDEEQLYVVRTDGTPQAIGGSLSNVIFAWSGCEAVSHGASNYGLYIGTDTNASAGNSDTRLIYYFNDTTTFQTILHFKFEKIASISTLIPHVRCQRNSTAGVASFQIGSVGGSASISPTNFAWVQGDNIDVSGLANGTAFDCYIEFRAGADNNPNMISAITIIGQ